MKKSVNMVYKSTTDCLNKMEILTSINAYLRRCDKASNKDDMITLEKCCKETELLIDRVLEMSLSVIQLESIDRYRVRVEKYKMGVNNNE